jgi:hypothetical protein
MQGRQERGRRLVKFLACVARRAGGGRKRRRSSAPRRRSTWSRPQAAARPDRVQQRCIAGKPVLSRIVLRRRCIRQRKIKAKKCHIALRSDVERKIFLRVRRSCACDKREANIPVRPRHSTRGRTGPPVWDFALKTLQCANCTIFRIFNFQPKWHATGGALAGLSKKSTLRSDPIAPSIAHPTCSPNLVPWSR